MRYPKSFQRQVAIVFAIGVWLTGATARAEQPTTADVEILIKKGSDLRRQGKDQLALGFYQRAYEASPTGRTSAQLGLCEMQLGYFLPAADHLERALSSQDDGWVDKNRDVLEKSLRRVESHIVDVLVSGTPNGAEVLIDGKVVGRLPLAAPLKLLAGSSQRVVLRAPGYEEASEMVSSRGGEQVRVVLHLARSSATIIASAPAESLADKARGNDARPAQTIPVAQSTSHSGMRVAAWSTAIGAAVLLAGGTIEMVVAANRLDTFGKTPAPDIAGRTCGDELRDYGGGECRTLHEDWTRARTFGLVGLISGGLLAGTSATLFILSGSRHNDQTLACAPTLPILGLSCAAHF